jgi:drug/metabolite transporter (DMT)-like permease
MLWSSSALLVDRLSTIYRLTPLQISTWRVLMVLPTVALFIAIYRPSAFQFQLRDLRFYIIAGLVGITGSNLSWAASVQINKPAVAAALAFSAPAFVAVGDRLFFGTRLGTLQMGAILVNLLGCGLVAGVHTPAQLAQSRAGLLVALANALAFSVYTLFGRGVARDGHRDPLTYLLALFTVGAIGLLTWGLLAEGFGLFALHLDATGWVLLGSLAAGPTLGAYALYNSSLRDLPATVASLVTTLEPPMVAIFASLLLSRYIKTVQWLGIGLIVSGVVAIQLGMRARYRGRKTSRE